MSLDVYLSGAEEEVACRCSDCGNEHKVKRSPSLYSSNITHNLGGMAEAAGIYRVCWRPEEIGITKAAQLIEPLRAGLAWLRDHPEEAKKHNAANGWGLYEHFVPWVEDYVRACEEYPDALVSASR